MSRSTYAVPSRKRRKMVLQRAKGFYGNASRNIRTAYDAVSKRVAPQPPQLSQFPPQFPIIKPCLFR